MATMLMQLDGLDGSVDLLSDRVVIRREGIFNKLKYGMNAKREIPIAAISEVVFRDASALKWGEIEFVRGGRSFDEKSAKKKVNPSAVRFKRNKQAEFEIMKEKIFELMAQYNRK